MKKVIVIGGIAALAAVGAWFAFRGGEPAAETSTDEATAKVRNIAGTGKLAKAREQIDAAAAAITNGTRRTRRVRIATGRSDESLWIFEDGKPWPDDHKELMRNIIAAADTDDFKAVAALAADVANFPNPEIREKYVEELGWFGEQAFSELTTFLSDPSEDVSDTARSNLTDAFQQIDSDAEKAALFGLLARAVTDSELLDSLCDELFGMDELLALQTIVDTIDVGTPKAQKAAKEVYETITDQKWDSVDSAEAWLMENYVDSDGDSDNDEVATKTSQENRTTSKTTAKKRNSSSSRRSSRSTGIDNSHAAEPEVPEAVEGEGVAQGEAENEGEAGEEGEDAEGDESEDNEDFENDENDMDDDETLEGDETENDVEGEEDAAKPPAPVLVD